MAKQTFTTGQVLTAAQMTSLQETAMGGGPATAKTASYVLVAADAGTTVAMNAAGSTTITVNSGLFSAGDTVFIQNLGAGNCTVTAGTATVATAGSLILPQNDAGILYFTSASAAIFYDYIQVGATSPLTTKGDLYTYSTSDARLAVGTNGQTLVADSSTATGLAWSTPSSGGGMTLIDEQTASSSTGIDFTSIGGSYKQLLLIWQGIGQNDGSVFNIRFNSDSGSNYAGGGIYLNGTSASFNGTATNTALPGDPFGQGSTTTSLITRNKGSLLVDNYASTTKLKYLQYVWSYSTSGSDRYFSYVGTYNSTSAITSINIVRTSGTGNFTNATNTSIRLYGVS